MVHLPASMRAVQLIGHGGPDMLIYQENVALPELGANEVLIKVAAAGINNTDINTRNGWYSKSDNASDDASWNGNALQFPRIQGADVCGEIVAVGDNVAQQRIGERVLIEPCLHEIKSQAFNPPAYYGSECDGGFAEYTTVAAVHAHKIDSSLTDIELASFPCSYSTAENLLSRTQVTANDTVLISGASGGVGSAAIQLAKARGAKVIAIASKSKHEALAQLGADRLLDRNADLIAELGTSSIDVVIDLVAGAMWPQFLEVLRSKGRYGVAGAIGGAMVNLDVRTLYLKDLSFFGCTILEPEVFPNLVKRIELGQIKPLVAKSFDLSEIHQAQAEFTAKAHIGKLVIRVATDIEQN